MNFFIKFLTFIFFLLLSSCVDYKYEKSTQEVKKYFTSHGFALIYDSSLYIDKVINVKMDNDALVVVHRKLKKNTPIKISNPINSNEVEIKISKRGSYPRFFNVLISKKIADILDIDLDNPYVEILEIKKNKKFVAKASNTFDEEKNVALKVPVKKVKIANLLETKKIIKKKTSKKKSFILVIGDFYYIDSANNLRNQLIKDTGNKNFYIKEIKSNQFRLYAGPFENFNTLKTTYISLNNLGFDELDVFQE